MNNKFASLMTEDNLQFARVFKEHGFSARIVGGAVRDTLLDNPIKDIDWATDARPEDVIDMFEARGFNVIPTGLQHGTVTVVINGEPFEVTTLRVDVETDGRHAEVEFTDDWKLDASRRDFTINAMYFDPITNEVFDFFGGIEDINKRQVRFIGEPEDRIREDYLRILRLFRFILKMHDKQEIEESKYVSSSSWDVMFGENYERLFETIINNLEGLRGISRERIWMEFSKIIISRSFPKIVDALSYTGVLSVIVGHDLYSFPRAFFKKVREHTIEPVVLLAVLDSNIIKYGRNDIQKDKKEYVDTMAEQMKMSAREKKLLSFIINYLEWSTSTNRTSDDFKRLLVHGYPLEWVYILSSFNIERNDIITDIIHWEVPIFPIDGKLLIKAGVQPGKKMGNILSRMKNRWMESDYSMTVADLLSSEGLNSLSIGVDKPTK